MRYLVVDVETSGLMKYRDKSGNVIRSDDPCQPFLAQLAMIMVNENFDIEDQVAGWIRPEGWVMEPAATAVNGLTDEFLKEHGRPAGEILCRYEEAIGEGRVGVAFNAQFDFRIIRGALRRDGRDDLFEKTPNVCVMRALQGICRFPQKFGKGYRWPKLREAMEFFDLPFVKAHEGSGDAFAAYQLMCKLNEMGELPQPRVYLAKGRVEEEEPV
jgi:DNA polymerase III subunit epsilon